MSRRDDAEYKTPEWWANWVLTGCGGYGNAPPKHQSHLAQRIEAAIVGYHTGHVPLHYGGNKETEEWFREADKELRDESIKKAIHEVYGKRLGKK